MRLHPANNLPSNRPKNRPYPTTSPRPSKPNNRARQADPESNQLQSSSARETLDSGLAICILGYSGQSKMCDSVYDEEIRQKAVMSEVLPDAEMWRQWEATEAPLRQGKGWYPALDRHFLELLVISEIQCLSNPLHIPSPNGNGQNDRIHRHASRVRRVACERIGAERLYAYCDRVKEAFEAYVSSGGWTRGFDVASQVDDDDPEDIEAELEEEGSPRGRGMIRETSSQRDLSPTGMSPVTPVDDHLDVRKDPFDEVGVGKGLSGQLVNLHPLDEHDEEDAMDVSLAGSTDKMDLDENRDKK